LALPPFAAAAPPKAGAALHIKQMVLPKRMKLRQRVSWIAVALLVSGVLTTALTAAILWLDDPFSVTLREHTEAAINGHSERLFQRLNEGRLTRFDIGQLHTFVLAGVAIGRFSYPEASMILYHYVYGDGSELELPSDYFRQSRYLSSKVAELGPGRHGPIGFKQHDDWRLSLALNPFFLDITGNRVRISHPRIEFAAASGAAVRTVVPIGKLRINVYDNLISALAPTPFAVYAEWESGR
jgi:hypothetical protein